MGSEARRDIPPHAPSLFPPASSSLPMFRYLAKRILLFVPTLLLASLLAFGLSKLTPGDPVLQYLREDPFGNVKRPGDLLEAERIYHQTAEKLKLDRPVFYFSAKPAAYPDTLYRLPIRHHREAAEKLVGQYGNWPQIEAYGKAVRSLDLAVLALPDSLKALAVPFKQPLRELYPAYRDAAIHAKLGEMEKALAAAPALSAQLGTAFFDLKTKYATVKNSARQHLLWLPSLRWHGLQNQYHAWLSGFVRGDYGLSLFGQRPVAEKLGPALFWTLSINLPAILLAFLLAVPLGVWSAVRQGERLDRNVSLGLFMLYSLPPFWIATMLIIFFTTREYGMDIFHGPGLGNAPAGAGRWKQLSVAAPHLLLPVLCAAYPSLAYIARQARGGMSQVLGQDYIRTARAKGLPERRVIWRHGFRNAVFPLITLFASVFPAAIAGSLTVEVVFNIPGMGLLMYDAIYQKDWPVVFTVLMMGAGLTVLGMLVADVLYSLADPRVRVLGGK